MAAEAKTLTLESELYEARRNIEVLEEKVQGVVGRGDLFKIRAEVKILDYDKRHRAPSLFVSPTEGEKDKGMRERGGGEVEMEVKVVEGRG